MAYVKQAWQSNELLTSEKLNHMEDGIVAAKTSEDIVNNLSETTTGKVLDATQGKVLNDSKLGNNFSSLSVASTPYSGNEQIALYSGGENYSTTVNELLSAAGGSGSSQSALVNYVKNCGTISSLPQTFTDANITADMVVLESVLGTPSAQTGDWTVTTSNGSVTISGSISSSTTLMLYFGVGMSAAPTLLTNLASTRSDNILKTAPRPGVIGTLGYANGGTNVVASSKQDLLDKMGVTDAIAQSAAKINSGLYVPTEPVPANGDKDYRIAFGKTYSKPPVVVANCRQSYTPGTEMTGPNIISIGLEGFTVRYKSSYSAALTPETTWIAIGN